MTAMTMRKRKSQRRPAPLARPVIYAISDSTGNLARHMLTAFLTQFPPGALSVHFEAFVRSEGRLDQVLSAAQKARGVVCHAMVSPAFKARITAFCDAAQVPCCDLTGGVVEFLSSQTGVATSTDLEALHRLDESYRQRIGALEFTLSHDDGLGTETLCDADIVLAGISRTSKTPTSIYLAQQGYRVANVALAYGVEPPPQLLALPPGRVMALTINPQQLVLIRTRREAGWRMDASAYGDPEHVAQEVAWARRLFARQHWAVLDVTDQAVEETAARIIETLAPARGSTADPDAYQAELA